VEKIKILIAEDSEDICNLYKAGLPADKFEITFTNNGEDALELRKTVEPDILLLDIKMPIMSGFAALKKLRAKTPLAKEGKTDPRGKKLPVVIMATAMKKREDIMDCVKLGINGYIVKPFSHKEIADKIISMYITVYPE